jgi:hypothetical protein
MTKSILFWMWIIVVVGMIVSILTLLIHCLQKPKKTCAQQNEICANSQECCDNLYCSTVVANDYKCVACITEGNNCENQPQCCSGLNCNSTSGKCEKCVSKIGGPCGRDSLCCDPLQCVNNNICANCSQIGGDCSDRPCCNELECNSDRKCSDPNCSKPCGDGKCCSDQYCDASNNCVDCKKKDEICELSTDCCGNNICSIDKKCSEKKEFEPVGAFLIVNADNTEYVSVNDGHDITWVDGSTAWYASTAKFWFWSLIQDKLYLGVEVKDVSNIGNRYYVMDPANNEKITLLGENNYPQNKNIKLNNDGTITNTTETLFLTKELNWSLNKSECYTFIFVLPSDDHKIGDNCIQDKDCALPYKSCTEGSCVACYQNGRETCNTSFFNRCNQKNPNKFNWECVVPSQICGTPTEHCEKDTEIQSCNPLTRKWECNQPSGQCSSLPPPPPGFVCGPSDKFQPMCNPNTNNNWICQSICTAIPDVKCDDDYEPICYADETTGLYEWHCVQKSRDSCESVPFSPNCLQADNKIIYDSNGNCSRKCPNDMTKNDLLNYLESPIDLVTDIPVVQSDYLYM